MNGVAPTYRTEPRPDMVGRMKTNPIPSELWTMDPAHTTIGFRVRHLMITNVRGTFARPRGTVRYDPSRPEATQIEVDIPADSVSTNEPQRDAHLRSPDFFDAEKFPTISFRSTGARAAANGALEVTGELTIRGTQRPVTLAVVEVTGKQRDHRGLTRIGASATTSIRRSDFGITYNRALEAGGIAIADEVALTFDVSLVEGTLP